MIRLLGDHLDAKFRRDAADRFVDELQSLQAVNVRFTAPEKIRVRTVQDEESKPPGAVQRLFISVHERPSY